MKKTGSCLCGKCVFSFECDNLEVGACHCEMCRKWSGGPTMAMHVDGLVVFENENFLKWYDSSEWGMRGFCSECWSNLVWSMKDRSMMAPLIGSVDDVADITFTTELFIDEKPEYYKFANSTKQMTWAEVFAEFSGE